MTSLLSRPELTLSAQDDTLVVAGDLAMSVAADVAARGVEWLRRSDHSDVCLDFTQISKANSVALSVLFEWLRACQAQRIEVRSIVLSPPLQRLASLAELDSLISRDVLKDIA